MAGRKADRYCGSGIGSLTKVTFTTVALNSSCRPVQLWVLSMIFHELGTNAAKHGAFSTGLGQVTIEWFVQKNELRLEWVESHGPVVQPPRSQGFGSLLIRHTVERELQGT